MKSIIYFFLIACSLLATAICFSLSIDASSGRVAGRNNAPSSDQASESRSKEKETKSGLNSREGVDLDRLNYTINGITVRFKSGVHQGEDGDVSIVASDTGDLDGDDNDDLVVVLRLDGAGSGIFFYVNAFLSDGLDRVISFHECCPYHENLAI